MGFKSARPNLPMTAVWVQDRCPAIFCGPRKGAASSPHTSLAKATAFCILPSERDKLASTPSQPPRKLLASPKDLKLEPGCDLHFLSMN